MTGFLDANDDPGVHAPSYYAATAVGGLRSHALEGGGSTDVAIIGGGYAGLSAAYHLAKAGVAVTLIEANRIGWGASGRNGGQIAAAPRIDMEWYERQVGRDDARKVFEIAREANALVRQFVADSTIDCELCDGVLEVNHRASFDAESEAYVAHMRETYGIDDYDYIAPEHMSDYVRGQGYFGGALNRRAGHLHPLNYALALGLAARDAGAKIYTMTRATALDIGASGVSIKTPVGVLTAKSLILAVNGYHDQLAPAYARRVMPINNFILATEPLGGLEKELIPADVAVADSRFAVNYFRLSRDGRMLFGGGETASAYFPSDIGAFVRKRMLKIFPGLSDAKIDYAWGGTLGISMNRTPIFQRIGPSAIAIGGWSGSGVHMATMGGKIAADAVGGQLEQFDMLAQIPSPAFPGGPALRSPLLRLALAWFRLRDWI